MNKFKQLGLNNEILKNIEQKGFTEPTYIQEKSIPAILKGIDVVGKSATGSGKTLAFGVGLVQNLKGSHLGGLVLTPTRELAEQVCNTLKEFSSQKIIAVYGGVGINPQISLLRKANIVVGTPGRILDHIQRGTINLSKVEIVVLDEADRMLDMGFIDDVTKIVRNCPRDRQTMLFSATISNDIERLQQRFMRDPITVKAQNQVDPSKLKQEYYDVKPNEKLKLLVTMLKTEINSSVLVFCNTRRMVDEVTKNLGKNGLEALAIHGGFTQAKRSSTFKKFQKNRSILVCSDVAARGLDIDSVSHVYNYDLPGDPKDYVHRIGRTARAGKEGKAINILSSRDHDNFSRIHKEFREIKITKMQVPKLVEVVRAEVHKKSFGGPRHGGPRRNGPRRNSSGSGGPRRFGAKKKGNFRSGSSRSESSEENKNKPNRRRFNSRK